MDLKLTIDHDLEIASNDLALVVDTEALAQRLKTKLQTFKGEWFLDTDFGVPYYQSIFRKGITKDIVDSIIKREIRNVPGVKSIASYNSSLDGRTREYVCNFVVLDDQGAPVEVTL